MTSRNWRHRILYVGTDHSLLKFLDDELKQSDCLVVRCPTGSVSCTLIKSAINYSLLLLDEKLPDMTGAELEGFARSLEHRQDTPVVIFKRSDDFSLLVKTIAGLLDKFGDG